LASKEYFKTALGLPRIYESTTMPGVVQNSKKSQKTKHYLKNGIFAVLDYCEIFILSGW